jgi:hypothetical protein
MLEMAGAVVSYATAAWAEWAVQPATMACVDRAVPTMVTAWGAELVRRRVARPAVSAARQR